MKRNRSIGCALLLIAACASATLAWAESPGDADSEMRGRGRMKQGPHGPMRQEMHAGMRAQMRAHDARLDTLVDVMNAAEGEAKVEAIAAVVNELVAQRRTRRAHMEERWQMRGRDSSEKPGETAAEPDTP